MNNMKGNTTRIILNERISAINRSKLNTKHYSPKAHFTYSNKKNSLTNNLILNSPILHTYTKSNGNNNNSPRSNTNSTGSNNIDNLKVAIRVRPPLPREMEKNLPFRAITVVSKENHTCSLVEYLGGELDEAKRQLEWVSNPKLFQLHRFTFDEVFDIGTSQEEVFNISAKPAVNSVLEGYNSTIFAYGQTGTGKTFTMEGFTYNNMDNSRGIIPRTIESIFSYIESNSNKNTKFIIRAAYLQIYNEMISDLLKPENTNKNLSIREDKQKGLKPIHPATLSLYLNGKSVPSLAYTRRLAKVLRVDPSWLDCNLPFEYVNGSKQAPNVDEMIDVYTRLDATWQRCILSTARMILIAMQYEPHNDDNK